MKLKMIFRKAYTYLTGWRACDFELYKNTFYQYGGNTFSHPDVIKFIASEADEAFSFYSLTRNGKVIAALFVNGDNELCGYPKNSIRLPFKPFDASFPLAPNCRLILPFHSKYISPHLSKNIINRLPKIFNKREVCILKEKYSSKTEKNRRNEFSRFIRSGGSVENIHNYTPREISNIYSTLHLSRWGCPIHPQKLNSLEKFIERNIDKTYGHILRINGHPCAFDFIIKSTYKNIVFYDVINGSIDVDYKKYSIGSVLMWYNYKIALEEAIRKNKTVRFNLGNASMDYKKRICDSLKLHRTL